MDKKIAGLMLLISIILTSAISTDFLHGIVTNYGIGAYQIGEVWTGYSNWQDYIKEADVNITKNYTAAYNNYVVEAVGAFTNQISAPIWEGSAGGIGETSPSGQYYEPHQRNIKVIQQIDGVWQEIPSQISKDTVCFDNMGSAISCSSTYYRVKVLKLYYVSNMADLSTSFKVIYQTRPLGSSPLYFYRFSYDSITGTYLQYNGTESVYTPLIKYTSATQLVNASSNMIIDFASDWKVTSMYAGQSTYGTMPITGDAFRAYSGTMTINGLPVGYDVNSSVVLEMKMTGANIMSQGSNTGTLYLDIMPTMIRHELQTTTPDVSANDYYLYFDTVTLSGTCTNGFPCSLNGYTGTTTAFTNKSSESIPFVTYSTTLASNTTSTSFGSSSGSAYFDLHFAGTAHEFNQNTPFVILTKSGKKLQTVGQHGFKCSIGACGNGETGDYYSKNYMQATASFSAGDSWVSYISLYQKAVTGYSQIQGFSTREIAYTSLNYEPNGGKIKTFITFSPYCITTTYTGNCNSDNMYEWTGLSCLSSNNIGYSDNCGNSYSCLPCDSCTDNGASFTCDGICIPKYTSSVTCYEGNLKIIDDCGIAYENCEYGCLSGACLTTESVTKLQVYVNDPVNSTVVSGAIVNLHGAITGFDKNLTTNFDGLVTFYVPSTVCYSVYASKLGYITGCNNPSTGVSITFTDGTQSCTVCPPLTYSSKDSFDIYPTGTSSQYTRVTFITKFGPDIVPNVTVNIYNNGILINSQVTDNSGNTTFTWDNYNYTNVTVGGSAFGYTSNIIPMMLIPLSKNNNFIIQLISQPSFNIFGGLTKENGNTIYAQLFALSDMPMNIYASKSGKMVLNRVDFAVKGCVDWPFCAQKKLYWTNCLKCRNCTKDSIGVKKYTLTDEDLAIAKLGKFDNSFISNLTGIDDVKSMDDMRTFIINHNCQMQKNVNTTGLKHDLVGVYNMICNVQEGTHYVMYRFPILSGTLTTQDMIQNAIAEPVKSLIEAFNSKNQDIFTEDVIFQCNNEAIAIAISEGNEIPIQYGTYSKTGTYIELISDPALRDIIRTGQPPLVLPNGEESYNLMNNFVGSGIAYDKQDRRMYIGDYRINVGNNNLGNSKKYPNAVTRNRIFGDIVSDLQAGQYVSSEVKYADINSKTVPSESGKIDQPTLFEITDYVRADFYPDDGGPMQTSFYRIIVLDTNLNVSEVFTQNMVTILLIIIFVLPGISIFYIVFVRKK